MDVWGPARVRGQGHERYFLLVIDDYSRYTTVFPLRSKGEVPEVLIDWIRGARRQLSECFGSDLPVLRLHSDRGGEFSFDLLRAYCRAEGIRQTFTLPASPQQNGIAERRIGMVMDVARTSMIHAAAPHFLWPFAVQYAAHQINLQPRVSLPETTPALRWTGKVGDASAFPSLLTHPGGSSTTPSRVVFCPLRKSHLTNPAEPVEVAVDSGAARGAEPAGAGTGGAGTGGAEPMRVEHGGAESGRAEPRGAELGSCRWSWPSRPRWTVCGLPRPGTPLPQMAPSWTTILLTAPPLSPSRHPFLYHHSVTDHSSSEAEIYAGAMAAQELRWLTYLLTDLGEAPRSPPDLYVDNKAMLALCQEHRLEHRTKHIALRYFLARELQQRGQLRLAYVAFQANTADVFTKALQPCDHQPCFAFLVWSCDLLFSPTLLMGVCQTYML
ncbi:unnamed protein product [Closterium sp. NIES-53]